MPGSSPGMTNRVCSVCVAALESAGEKRVLPAGAPNPLTIFCNAFGEGAEAGAHALAERLERLEPRRPAGGVDADTLGRAVIHRDEDRGLTSSAKVEVRSVPHISSTRSVRRVPSWVFGPCGRPTQPGAWRPCSRVKRRTRRLEVRMPAKRSRAQISGSPRRGAGSRPAARGSPRPASPRRASARPGLADA